MKIRSLNLNEIPRVFFWDVDIDLLDLKRDYFFVIARILSFTTADTLANNIEVIRTQFNLQTIQEVLKNTDELISNEIYKLMSQRYNIPNYSKLVKITA